MPKGVYPRRNHVTNSEARVMNERDMDKRIHDLESQLAISEAEKEEARESVVSYKETQRILEAKIEALQDALVAITRAEY